MSDIDALNTILNILYEHEEPKLAMELVERFGDVRGIFLATYEELMSVDGVTPRVASFFNCVNPLRRQAYLRTAGFSITDKDTATAFAAAYCLAEASTSDLAVYLDGKGNVIAAEKLAGKEITREIVEGVCRLCAKKLVWIRYLPRGKCDTIEAEKARKKEIEKLSVPLEILGVELIVY